MKVASEQKLDDVDARRIREMIASAPFRVFTDRVNAELARHQQACERSDVAVDIHRAQGATQALRTVLALPERILQEIRANVSGSGR